VSKAKKLDLSLEQLIRIAQALNENTLANRKRSKEEKISTDIFIKRFGIARKDFSESIKDSPIKYNQSTFLYDIPKDYHNITPVNRVGKESSPNENTAENQSNLKVIQKNTAVNPMANELQELISLKDSLKEMLQWYEEQLKKNSDEPPVLNINKNDRLKGVVVTKSFKLYKDVHDEFMKFASKRKETQKDLLSLAILEFIEKYDR
jgi:hypothetical protein